MRDYPASRQDVPTVGKPERPPGVLFDQQGRHPLVAQLTDELEDLVNDLRSETKRGLVIEDHARFRHERAGDGQLLLLAAGERAGDLLTTLRKDREAAEHPLQIRVFGPPRARRRPEAQVLLHGQRPKDPATFGNEGQARARDVLGEPVRDSSAIQADDALGRSVDPGDRAQERRLAGPVRPEDDDDLTPSDVKVHATERGHHAVADREPGDLDEWCGHVLYGLGTKAGYPGCSRQVNVSPSILIKAAGFLTRRVAGSITPVPLTPAYS